MGRVPNKVLQRAIVLGVQQLASICRLKVRRETRVAVNDELAHMAVDRGGCLDVAITRIGRVSLDCLGQMVFKPQHRPPKRAPASLSSCRRALWGFEGELEDVVRLVNRIHREFLFDRRPTTRRLKYLAGLARAKTLTKEWWWQFKSALRHVMDSDSEEEDERMADTVWLQAGSISKTVYDGLQRTLGDQFGFTLRFYMKE